MNIYAITLRISGLLHQFQPGFRKSFSTETALLRIVDQILFDLDKDKVTGLVFVDYKKVFDLIDHDGCGSMKSIYLYFETT